ncbi:MAG: PQQ-binding-like beta-propeller repeat protein [Pirellulaceae bacterium]
MSQRTINVTVWGMMICGLLLGVTPCAAQDWPQFRGPSAAGLTTATDVPLTWSDTENLLWKVDLPGPGSSSPVIWGERLYLTCYTGYGLSEEDPGEKENLVRRLLCFDRSTGELLWQQDIPATAADTEDYQGFIALHGYASSTPAVDASGVYVFYGTVGAAAYDHDGTLKWRTPLGTQVHEFGTGNSPVLHEDLVIINAAVESNRVVALRKETGELAWERTDVQRSWNTPIVVETESGTELVFNDERAVRGLDPQTGEQLWHCEAHNRLVCPSLIAHAGVVYAVGARDRKTIAIQAGGRGDVTESHLLWELDKVAHVSSPLFYQGHLYWVSDSQGIAYCVDAESGKLVYEQRITPRPGRMYASPVLAAGHLLYVSREAGTYVLPAEPEYSLVAHNRFASDESVFHGSPAVVDDRIYLRSDQTLYCVGK